MLAARQYVCVLACCMCVGMLYVCWHAVCVLACLQHVSMYVCWHAVCVLACLQHVTRRLVSSHASSAVSGGGGGGAGRREEDRQALTLHMELGLGESRLMELCHTRVRHLYLRHISNTLATY